MSAKRRPGPTSKIAIRGYSEQPLAIRYAELLRLRQAVCQAELLSDDCGREGLRLRKDPASGPFEEYFLHSKRH